MKLDERSQRTREKIVLSMYFVYVGAMTGMTVYFHWDSWILPVITIGFWSSVYMSVTRYRTYVFRSYYITIMTWMTFSIYMVYGEEFVDSFATMAGMIVMLAILNVPKITFVGVVVYSAHLVYHLMIAKDLVLTFGEGGVKTFLKLVCIYTEFYVTYHLMRAQIQSNEILYEKIEEVKLAEQSKDDFMANMSHEIRTPINTVCGISEMALRRDLSDEDREDFLDVQTAGRQLLSLVSDILDYSELSSGNMEILPDTYNVTSTINDILNIALANMEKKKIELIVDCDADIPNSLVGDEQKIRRAVMNVLDNAIKFTDEGGILFRISFRKEDYGGNLVITIQDTGIGMQEEELDRLFTRFTQVDASRNRRAGGMGLGLSIAKVIVDRMEGFISVKSEYGQGTQIRMVIPQKINKADPVAVLSAPEECRVLLFLDVEKYQNALVRTGYMQSLGHMVQQLHMNCHHARSLLECRRIMEKGDFNYLFVGWDEYCVDRDYFEKLSEHIHVVLILERDHRESVMGSHMMCVYKPFYVLTMASVLNGQYVEHLSGRMGQAVRFVAPTAQILVVDDNLMNLRVVEGLLRPYKFKVFTAESGKDALEQMELERFDLVFMDHMMPEMDGVETFHRIRQKPGRYFKEVPIVALTANAVAGAREMFLQEGFVDYVAKPIELSALERVLAKFIPGEKKIHWYDEGFEGPDGGAAGQAGAGGAAGAPGGTAGAGSPPAGEAPSLDLPGVDLNLGLRYYAGRMEDYLEIIRIYYKEGLSKKDRIREYAASGNWKDYTTLVHALKSTSLNIGAAGLSEKAKALEAAGKKEDAAYIGEHTEEVLTEYEALLSAIGNDRIIFPEKEEENGQEEMARELPVMEKDELKSQLDEMDKSLEGFDLEAAVQLMEELEKYQCEGKALKDLLSAVRERADDFEYDEAREEITKVREALGV